MLVADFQVSRFRADLDDLPDGVFVTGQGLEGGAWLLWRGGLLAWSPGGYRERRPRSGSGCVEVLTPASTVRAIRAAYAPVVHPSAEV